MPANYNRPRDARVLGDILRQARVSACLSLTELQEKSGVHHTQISRIERGQFRRPSTNVQKLCKIFDINWQSPNSQPEDVEALCSRIRGAAKTPNLVRAMSIFLDAIAVARPGRK
jgi:transcriptional regulator with XRE-family HTH domain